MKKGATFCLFVLIYIIIPFRKKITWLMSQEKYLGCRIVKK
jgi:hypothetical protein